jgi:hypothetical protein
MISGNAPIPNRRDAIPDYFISSYGFFLFQFADKPQTNTRLLGISD